jgi:DNA-binding PadR family transcriptional regulator
MRKRLSEAEHAVLHTVEQIGGGYGLQIVALAEQLAFGSSSRKPRATIKRSGIYVLLGRMERKGFVESRYVDPEPGERGPRRRVYRVTDLGSRQLRASEAHDAVLQATG